MNPLFSPAGRAGQGMVYDKESDRIISFGGFGGRSIDDSIFADTWAYNFNTNEWTKMKPKLKQNKWKRLSPEVSPPPIADHNMAYDAIRNTILLFGGELGTLYSNKLSGDLWIFDSRINSWTKK